MKKILSLMMCFAMLLLMVAGCSKGAEAQTTQGSVTGAATATAEAPPEATEDPDAARGKLTITLGLANLASSADYENYPDQYAAMLMEKFNIDLQYYSYDAEQLSVLLTSGALYDIMMIFKDDVSSVLTGGLAEPLDEYLDQYGPHIQSETFASRNTFLRSKCSDDTESLYFLTPQTTAAGNTMSEDEIYTSGDFVYGYVVRWDLYKEAGYPEILNDDDYYDFLVQTVADHPTTENGDKMYAMGMDNEISIWGWQALSSYSYYGYLVLDWNNPCYVQDQAGENDLVNNYLDLENSAMWKDLALYNRLYRAGVFDPDSFVMKHDEIAAKFGKGQYVGGNHASFTSLYNDANITEDPDTMKVYRYIPNRTGWYGNCPSYFGWTDKYFFVFSGSENKVRAVKLLDYLHTEDAARTWTAGVQGLCWDYDDTGKPYLFDSTIEMVNSGDSDAIGEAGINSSIYGNFMFMDSGYVYHSDGYPINLWHMPESKSASEMTAVEEDFCEAFDVEFPLQAHMEFPGGQNLDNALSLVGFMPTTPDEIARIDARLLEIMTNAIPTVVTAATEEDFNMARDAVLEDLKDAGADEAWNWWKTNWDTVKAEVYGMLGS